MEYNIIDIGSTSIKIADGNYSAKYPSKKEFVEEGIPFIRANNFNNKTIVDDQLYFITPEKHATITKGHLLPNDVLITTRGNIGEVAIVPERHKNSNINAQIVLLRCNDEWYPLYLLYVLSSNFVKEQLPALTTGTALKQLPVRNLKKIKIPLPPLATQKKIAAILDEADTLRQLNKDLITKYDALAQSLFLDMFGDPVTNPMGWEIKLFSEVATNLNSKRKPIKQSDRELIVGKFPYYGATGIVSYINDFKFDGEYLLIAEDGKNLVNRKKPIAWVAKGQFWVNNHAHVVGYNGSVSLFFLAFYLNKINISQYVTGIDQFKMNKSNLNRIPILIPPITLQNKFAERIAVIEQQKAQAQQSLQKSEDLFNSLLQKAFKGELV